METVSTWMSLRDEVKRYQHSMPGVWEAKYHGSDTLPLPINEMTDDILGWLQPNQGWKLARVSSNFMHGERDEGIQRPNEPQLRLDRWPVVFNFDAENPPTRRGLGKPSELDLAEVFIPAFRSRTRAVNNRNILVFPEKIGEVYPLDEALEHNTPFYLFSTEFYTNTEAVQGAKLRSWGDYVITPREAKSLLVMVNVEDLLDWVKLQKARLTGIEQRFAEFSV